MPGGAINRPREMWAWDTDNSENVRVAVDSSGRLITAGVIDDYKINDQDNTSPYYYGFERADGYWYIMKRTVSGTDVSFRYASGTTDYATAWTNRATQSYNTFGTEF
jgi:hypothetical protein